jgi:hypothetical protein
MGESRNTTGCAYALTTFAAIIPGHEDEVRATIEGLPRGQASPLARLENVHTSRLQIFDHLVYQGPPQQREELQSNYLVFTAAFDGALDPFLDALIDRLAPEADSWWRHCIGYPGLADRVAFKRWLRRSQVHTSLFGVASPNQTVATVLESLALREKVLAFAISVQGLPANEVQERFRRTFVEVK